MKTKSQILHEHIKNEGWEGHINKGSGLEFAILKAMQEYKDQTESKNPLCRLHSKRANCSLFRINQNACGTCPHFNKS